MTYSVLYLFVTFFTVDILSGRKIYTDTDKQDDDNNITTENSIFTLNIFQVFDEAKHIFENVLAKIVKNKRFVGIEASDWI